MMKMNRVICVLAVLLCIACGYAMAASAAEVKGNEKNLAVREGTPQEGVEGEVTDPALPGVGDEADPDAPPKDPDAVKPEEDEEVEDETDPGAGDEDEGEEDDNNTQDPPAEPEQPDGEPKPDKPGQPEDGKDEENDKEENDKPSTQEPTSTNAPSNEQKPGDADSSFSPVWMRTAAPLLIVAALVL